ncbi:MAG: hypothetical protein AAFZ87_08480, partial [Planctomycetota bacterium]
MNHARPTARTGSEDRIGGPRTDGNALVASLLLVTALAATTSALLNTTVEASEIGTHEADRYEARRAGRSVNRMAARHVWTTYSANVPVNEDVSLLGARAGFSNQGLAPQPDGGPYASTDLLPRLGLARNGRGERVLGDIEVVSVDAYRVDLARATRLVVTTTTRVSHAALATSRVATEITTEVFTVEPSPWDGLDYALLANNINCIMCHTTVDDARRMYAGDGIDVAGSAGRAKVG